jgi:hypothetical protein
VTDQIAFILNRLQIPQSYLDFAFGQLKQCHATQAEFSAARRQKLQSQQNAGRTRLDSLLQLKISPANVAGALLTDEEYLRQKTQIKEELDLVQRQLANEEQQAETWIVDCERFFVFTQHLPELFATSSVENKRAAMLLICSKLTLANHQVDVEFSRPFAQVAAFPLAGRPDKTQSERQEVLAEAEKPEIMEHWLAILDAIRTRQTFLLPF